MGPTFRIISYNIHKGFSPVNKQYVLPEIRNALKNIAPDILFLQEVQGKQKPRLLNKMAIPDQAQQAFIADQRWPHYIYAKNAVYAKGHHGNALLSMHPFIRSENINVALSKRASRSVLHGVLQLPYSKLPLHVICIHLGLFRMERHLQLTVLSERIKATVPAGEPLIIAGDFNDWREHAQLHLEEALGLAEVFKLSTGEYAKTYPARHPAFKVDRIYFRGITLQKGKVLDEPPWKRLSDHLPLQAEFVLNSLN